MDAFCPDLDDKISFEGIPHYLVGKFWVVIFIAFDRLGEGSDDIFFGPRGKRGCNIGWGGNLFVFRLYVHSHPVFQLPFVGMKNQLFVGITPFISEVSNELPNFDYL